MLASLADLIQVNSIELTETIQEDIATRGEFFSLRYGQQAQSNLFRYQEIVKRLMITLDRLMIYHRPGRGKTCAISGGVEYYHSLLLNTIDTFDASQSTANPIQKVVIVTRASLVERFKEEMYRVCTDRYTVQETEKTKEGLEIKMRNPQYKKIRDNAIGWGDTGSVKLSVMSYDAFDSMFIDKSHTETAETKRVIRSPEYIAANWSNSIFVFDEVHLLKKVEDVGGGGDEPEANSDVINVIKAVADYTRQSKIFLSSGTFIVNYASDFAYFANIIIKDKWPADTDWSNMTIELFNKHMRGYISYMEEPDVKDVEIEYVGSELTIEGETFTIAPVVMSQFQDEVYRRANDASKAKGGDGFYTKLRNISQFAMPDNIPKNCIQAGVKRMVSVQTEQGLVQKAARGRPPVGTNAGRYTICGELKKYIQIPENIQRSSAGWTYIIKQCQRAENKCFIFNNYVLGSGAILMGECFKALGFEEITGKENVDILINNPNPKRFMVYSRMASEDNREAMLKIYNHQKNIYGGMCKIFIGTPIAREGISLDSVLNVFLPEMWNYALMMQALFRAYRITSFDNLKRSEPNRKFIVRVYKIAPVLRNEEVSTDSVSIRLFKLMATKEREIAKIDLFSLRTAVDCPLNLGENDKGRGLTCYPFDTKIDDVKIDEVDFSNMNVNYVEESSKTFTHDLSTIVRTNNAINLTDVHQFFASKFPALTVDVFLSYAQNHKRPVYDRYGKPSFVEIRDNIVYFTPFFPESVDNAGRYINIIPVNQFQSLQTLIKVNNVFGSKNILTKVKDYSTNEMTKLLEQAATEPDQVGSSIILQKYNLFIRQIPWPEEAIEQYKRQIHPEVKKKGHPVKTSDKLAPVQFKGDLVVDPNARKVWVHHLQDILVDEEYAISSLFTKIIMSHRILTPEGWRDADYYERGTLNAVFAQIYKDLTDPYTKLQVYGMYSAGSLRIIDKEKYPKGRRVNNNPKDVVYYLNYFNADPSPNKSWDMALAKGGQSVRDELLNKLIDIMREQNVLLELDI